MMRISLNFISKLFFTFFLLFLLCVSSFAASLKGSHYRIPEKNAFDPASEADNIELILNTKYVISSEVVNGFLTFDPDELLENVKAQNAEYDDIAHQLNDSGLQINRDLKLYVGIVCRVDDIDSLNIVLTKGDLSFLSNAKGVRFILTSRGDVKASVGLSRTELDYIKDKYGEFKLAIKPLEDSINVRFLNSSGVSLDEYGTDILLAVRADNVNQTIRIESESITDNWGGQFNEYNSTIEFKSKISGEYSVISPEITVNDIDALSSDEQQAIMFMLVRDYFTISRFGMFKPDASVTRNNLAQAFARMFFALDNDAVSSFNDVGSEYDAEYYRYIASLEKFNIINGIGNGKFGGNFKVSLEELLAISSRTLHDFAGYTYPEDTYHYLSSFDSGKISPWAQKEIAMAVREGVYSPEIGTDFSMKASRKTACIILYRMFMLINNTPKKHNVSVASEISSLNKITPFWNFKNMLIICSVSLIVLISSVCLAYFLVFRKKA